MSPDIHQVTYDEAAGAVYLSLTKVEEGSVTRSVPIEDTPIVLDFNTDGTLIGIESLDPNTIPAELLDQATEI